ncbi:hypothetical protein IAR50_004194 [Cryptococcus sp. DSM 104548]
MAARPASSGSSRPPSSFLPSRPPLEQLVSSLIPSLAPVRGARPDDPVEKERRERVEELTAWCQDILDSNLPSSIPLSENTLPDFVKRMVYSSKTTGSESGSNKALRLSSIWSKLERGRLLSSPTPHLQFLAALSDMNPNNVSRGTANPPRSSNYMAAPAFPSTKAGSSKQPMGGPGALDQTELSGKGKSRAEMLKEWRTLKSQPTFPPHLLLRDALYLLQGIDGRYVHFAFAPPKEQNPYLTEKGKKNEGTGFPLGRDGAVMESAEEGEEVVGIEIVADEVLDGHISQPTRTLLMQISEMGMIYRRVTGFIESRQSLDNRGGMIEQSLCHFLHHDLSEYHRLLAVLESQMNMAPPADPDKAAENGGLTLMRLGLWTEEMRLKLRQMDAIVEEAKAHHGGALVSRIHSHTSNGDPLIRSFTNDILSSVSKPFFLTLQRWIFSGELHDPFKEFFVQLNPDAPRLKDGPGGVMGDGGWELGMEGGGELEEAYTVWEKKYVFVKKMVPGFVTEDFAKKIFSTGRSLNFIRYSCHDSDWIETQAKLANAGRDLSYSDLAGLERSIDDAYSIASQRLLEIFFDKFRLLDHLRALKSFLMLGAGDFTELLMESLAPRLSKPAISLYRHHLTSDLESAIRGSNAQFSPPDILRRLDARMLEYSHGETGWDCFALQYKVEAPLNAVLDGRAMGDYDRLFNHLWRLKRVEVSLTQNWMRATSGSKAYEYLPGLNNDWHHCRVVQSEMVHFLRQIQAFCQLEVIECSWAELMEYTEKREGDLDTLIAAHRKYLSRVVKKILLLSSKREKEEILLDLVRDALDLILQFTDATDDLYAWSLAEATRLDRQRDALRGLYTPSAADDDPSKSEEQLQSVRIRIRNCANDFHDKVTSVVHMTGAHQDLDVRFLGIRIGFNGFFKLKKKDKGASSKSTRG